ncbi:5-bromo-4-chloroindolyl phosphate hydrolysis family protein [Mediterraneibacter glycyrrhizinilyticus]|uniref:5-bromo-4-chloroindolyl phosphate hydrolysis family protein n=1 Tax=Mediterraneibacter glycyrrhizinilyticus TaxID=342942 RepID=UPI0025A3EBBE|nr:5-bromo-4-chloroindolyl phosphate hydrolysis family protein [Mediterraneibacter glycyrrhizinilyticus]MDM8209576.1 5-bromo-4-chloroindolyl phosphate hydrolysis family protein [Mediterraneibacter glycyrrhizinilyticus]
MINNGWERFGDEIRRTIQNAVDSRDFSSLNQTVSDTIGKAMDTVSRGMKDTKGAAGVNLDSVFGNDSGNQKKKYETRRADYGQQQYQQPERPAKKLLYLKGTSTRIGGIFLAVTGYIFTAGSIIFLLLLALGAAATGFDLVLKVGMTIFGLFGIAFLVMGIAGTNMACSVGRFRKYVKVIKEREYCEVKELAQKTGKSVKTVVKDLKKMIRKGWFCQGHLDEQGTCLMTSNEAYSQYTALMERTKREKAEREAEAARQQQEFSKLSPEVQKIIQAGDEYVRKIREANDAIPGEEISAKMSRMEMLVDRIFDRVEEHPESVADIRKLMEYYLPTTIKLLDAYEDLDAQSVQGENIITAKKEIEKTIDTLNTAFEKLLDDLFQDTAWDLSSDISVLQTMLAQEGLTEDGLKNAGRKL